MNNTTILAVALAPAVRWAVGKFTAWADRVIACWLLVYMPNGRLKSLALFSTDNRWHKYGRGTREGGKPAKDLSPRSGE